MTSFCLQVIETKAGGAVANEAMANGCVVVGSHEIGSIPYLIQDLSNGLCI